MNLDQRTEFMKREVLPKSKAIFVAFDEKKYKDMDCATCHGDGAADGSFEMPNPKDQTAARRPKKPSWPGSAKMKSMPATRR